MNDSKKSKSPFERMIEGFQRAPGRAGAGRDLLGSIVGRVAAPFIDFGKHGSAASNVLTVRCACGQELQSPAGKSLPLAELGGFAAIHGHHGAIRVTTQKEDGTRAEETLSPELAAFAGSAMRGLLSQKAADAAADFAAGIGKKAKS